LGNPDPEGVRLGERSRTSSAAGREKSAERVTEGKQGTIREEWLSKGNSAEEYMDI